MQLRTLYATIYSVELWGLFFTLYDERCPFLVEADWTESPSTSHWQPFFIRTLYNTILRHSGLDCPDFPVPVIVSLLSAVNPS